MKKILFAVLCLWGIAASLKAAQVGSGAVYSVVELSFTGPNQTPSNAPAKDIDFWVEFQHESGSPTYKIYGFWDGDGNGGTSGSVFKIRFCPTATGKWYLNNVYSNNSLLNNQKEGDYISATASSNKGFWIVDPNSEGNRWFMRSDGSHQYIVGNTHYDFLAAPNGHETNSTEIRTDIDQNARYFTKLRFQIAATNSKNNTGTLRTFFDASGNQTFTESDRPNPKYFAERVDAAVKRGLEKDLICDLILGGSDQKLSSEAYLKYVVARYGAYPNVWFCLNNEWNEASTASYEKSWGQKIEALMAYPNPVSTHATRGWDANLNGTWCTHSIRQGKLPSHLSDMYKCADAIVTDYNAIGGNKPGINDENGYDPNESSEQDVLEGMVGSFAGGGYGSTGHKTGDKAGGYFWGYTSQGWTADNHPSADNLGWMKDIINTNITFWKMKPIKPASGNFFANANANFRALEWTGQQYVLVSDAAQSGISVTLPAGSWSIYQYNIISKSTSTLGTSKTGSFSFSTPSSRACITFFKNVGPDPTPVAPVLLSPANGSSTTILKPTFSWNAVSYTGGISSYDISINGTVYNAGNATTFTPSANLPLGSISWKVRAIGNNGMVGDWSSTWSLTITSNNTVITAPTAGSTMSPLGQYTATGSGQNLSWTVAVVGGASLATGTGASITFTVPATLTTGNQIRITLTGDGGTVSQTHDILDRFPMVTTESADLGAGAIGVVYNDDIEAADGDAPYSWTGRNMPPGLSIQATGGNLVGIPTQAGSFTFTVTVFDADGDSATKNLTVLINDNPNQLTVSASSDVTSGQAPLTVAFSAVVSGGQAGGTGAFVESGGSVVMEAENYESISQNGDVTNWQLATSQSGYTAGGYMATPNNGVANGAWATACDMSYRVQISTPGTYYIGVRRIAATSADDSWYMGIDGTQKVQGTGTATSWKWSTVYTLGTLTAGEHVINIRRREDGLMIDRIMLSTSSSAIPASGSTVAGPAESARGGSVSYSYSWNFGDGTASSQQNPSHTYTSAGNYTATVTVGDGTTTATDNVAISVTSATTYTLTVNAGSGGTVIINPDKSSYQSGEPVTVTAFPDPGYLFEGWTGDASGTTNPLVLTMNASKNIGATFIQIQGGDELSITNITPTACLLASLQTGLVYYTDRTYTVTSVPSGFTGLTVIRTPNGGKTNTSASYLNFTVNKAVEVYVAYDSRATSLPNWLSGWENTGLSIGVTDGAKNLNLYKKDYAAGAISLGGNLATGAVGSGSNYIVVVNDPTAVKSEILVSQDVNQSRVIVYPNPVADRLVVNNLQAGATLRLLNVSGQVMQTAVASTNSLEMNLEGLNQGLYMLLISSEHEVQQVKVIKK